MTTCQDCRFWDEPQCKRYPPTEIITEIEKSGYVKTRESIVVTDPDEWCGEHQFLTDFDKKMRKIKENL